MARDAPMEHFNGVKWQQQVESRVRGVGDMEGASEMSFSLEDRGIAPRRVALVVGRLDDDGDLIHSPHPSACLPCPTIGFSGGATSDARARHDDSEFKAVSSLKRREGIDSRVTQLDHQVIAACDKIPMGKSRSRCVVHFPMGKSRARSRARWGDSVPLCVAPCARQESPPPPL